jgi:hypothetical protein
MDARDIEQAFDGTDFGGREATDVGRRGLMLECVLKRATGYHDGHTITSICKGLGLVSLDNRTTSIGMSWAFDQLYISGGGPSVLERIAELEKVVTVLQDTIAEMRYDR